ncbi:MAG: peptide deformylase [Candidatus Kapaibacterium sp.]|jgi:peptide deformylase
MAILPIYNSFHPVMKQKTKQVLEINDEIKEIVADMFETMYYTKRGVGLAANQVGKDISVVVIDVHTVKGFENELPMAMINPVITEYSDEKEICEEGCLSIPVLYDDVERSLNIKIKYLDITGKEIERTATGFLARAMQHEVDHLNGINFYDRLSPLRKSLAKSKMKRLKKGDYDVDYAMINADGTEHPES